MSEGRTSAAVTSLQSLATAQKLHTLFSELELLDLAAGSLWIGVDPKYVLGHFQNVSEIA